MNISCSFSVLPKPQLKLPLKYRSRIFHRVHSTTENSNNEQLEAIELTKNENNNSNTYKLIGLLATAGSLETAYLTYSHFNLQSVFCPSWSSCQSVLSSSYSEIFGIPLSLFGFIVYATLASLAFYAGNNDNRENSSNYQQFGEVPILQKRWNIVQQGIVGCSVLLVSCSMILMYILLDKVENPWCIWCMLSIFLSTSVGVSVWSSLDSREIREAVIPSMGLASSVVLTMSFWLSWVDGSQAEVDIPFQQNVVTTESSEKGIQIAKLLRENGAKMYGAFWCSHCFEQKQMFGQQAMGEVPYVECYPEGYRKGVKMVNDCVDANLQGFPTWVINGQKIEGEQTLEQLEDVLNGGSFEQSQNGAE